MCAPNVSFSAQHGGFTIALRQSESSRRQTNFFEAQQTAVLLSSDHVCGSHMNTCNVKGKEVCISTGVLEKRKFLLSTELICLLPQPLDTCAAGTASMCYFGYKIMCMKYQNSQQVLTFANPFSSSTVPNQIFFLSLFMTFPPPEDLCPIYDLSLAEMHLSRSGPCAGSGLGCLETHLDPQNLFSLGHLSLEVLHAIPLPI